MKKFLLTLALTATFASVSAQQTYNYFEAADVDAEGWLWLDSKEKLDKYCGFCPRTNLEKYKIALTETGYTVADIFGDMALEPKKDPTIQGYNAEGVKGGEGSKTGGIVLPIAKDFHYIMNNKSLGGGIAFYLPDLAEISIYMSVDQKEAFMSIYYGESKKHYNQLTDFANYWHGEGLESLHNPVPGINFCGTWENIQNTVGYDPNNEVNTYIVHEPGKPVSLWFPSLTDGHEIIIHGVKVLTYTNTVDDSAVNDIYAEEDENAPAYNLMGLPVDENYKGIVIKNGKKSIRK